ncbi:MAG: hypothetical protein A2283_17135 [Lentisphaerae bacterium RIFOXYA12_FULL_48_11]|nr:MAG: hypothetical protein A2283_17135 [Lentisphaerae bacterium RIFOXYA12_FULL_48_11]
MQLIEDIKMFAGMPKVCIDLMYNAVAGNDPFYAGVVRDFFEQTQKRHSRLRLARQFEYGVALCSLPGKFDEYYMLIESSARRNYKKAERLGYRFERIAYNKYLDDVRKIRQSAIVRQGQMPESLVHGEVTPCSNPLSKTNVHDYPFFGIIKEGKLVAYTNCLVSGEVCMIEHMFGHASYQQDGIVPMLIIETARYAMTGYPNVRYFTYGTFFGAGQTMRRFKKKFGFIPHRVEWLLD